VEISIDLHKDDVLYLLECIEMRGKERDQNLIDYLYETMQISENGKDQEQDPQGEVSALPGLQGIKNTAVDK
jgi:hypothetical protein